MSVCYEKKNRKKYKVPQRLKITHVLYQTNNYDFNF